MALKEIFKPNNNKIIFSILLLVLTYFFFVMNRTLGGFMPKCSNNEQIYQNIITGVRYCATPIGEKISIIISIIMVLIPSMLLYLIWSLISYFKQKRKK